METQTFQHRTKINIHTCVKLELTAGPCILTGSIIVGKDIGLVRLGTCKEFAINDVCRRRQGNPRLFGSRIYIGHRNQRSNTVRTPTCCCLPITTAIGRTGIVISCIGIHIRRDIVVDTNIHITTYIETVGVVILGFTKLKIVTKAIVTYVRIELGTIVTTLNLYTGIRTVISLLDVL